MIDLPPFHAALTRSETSHTGGGTSTLTGRDDLNTGRETAPHQTYKHGEEGACVLCTGGEDAFRVEKVVSGSGVTYYTQYLQGAYKNVQGDSCLPPHPTKKTPRTPGLYHHDDTDKCFSFFFLITIENMLFLKNPLAAPRRLINNMKYTNQKIVCFFTLATQFS